MFQDLILFFDLFIDLKMKHYIEMMFNTNAITNDKSIIVNKERFSIQDDVMHSRINE